MCSGIRQWECLILQEKRNLWKVVACPISGVGSYMKHNKRDRDCELLHQSRCSHGISSLLSEEALSYISHPNNESSARVQKEVRRGSKILVSLFVSYSPPFGSYYSKLLVWQLVGCRYLMRGRRISSHQSLSLFFKNTCTCCKRGLVISERKSRRGDYFYPSKIYRARKCCSVHLVNEKPMW